jgi:L-ascorbate metabolism protein UlaG (beta-lactamase superfamily)
MRQAKFGKAPSGERLTRMHNSPNYKDGKFRNIVETPTLAEGYSMAGEIYKSIFRRNPRRAPATDLPAVKNNLKDLPAGKDLLIWFGHSSYLLQLNGKRILVDPVFSGNASPVPGTVKSFKGTDIYTVDDLPEIDYLLISHDHYDHLDYETILKLKARTSKVFCGLGVGSHFELWDYPADKINEMDWHDSIDLGNGFTVSAKPARHKSGRTFSQDNTLWVSYLLNAGGKKVYIGGDSGYGTHFADVGALQDSIDLAILENGQYDSAWHYIHCLPEEVLKAGRDLKAKRIFPVHSSKFALAKHAWDEPLIELTRLNETYKIPLLTPVIGEVVNLEDDNYTPRQWWKGIK